MNTNRRGKIAKLPRGIREQLNRRLEEGEEGAPLAEWLNNVPEVKAMLAAEFGGQPINETNLSNWKQGGGYADWLAQQEARLRVDRVIEDAGEIEGAKGSLLGDRLAVWVISRLILAAGTLGAEGAGEKDWKLLRELSHDVAELRKGDRGAGWLLLEKERLADERKQQERRLEEEFLKWAEKPEVRDAICQGHVTHAEKLAMIREALFGNIERLAREKRPLVPGEGPDPEESTPPNQG